jgi:hypothetical protein
VNEDGSAEVGGKLSFGDVDTESAKKLFNKAGGTYEMIDNTTVGADAWSSKNVVDKLCPGFTESGVAVICRPVEGYPLEVVSHIDTECTKIKLTHCGKNILDTKNPKVYHNNAVTATKLYTLTETGFRAESLTDTTNDLGRLAYYLGTTKELAGKTLTMSGEFYSSVNGQYVDGMNYPLITFYCTDEEPCRDNANIDFQHGGYIGSSGMITNLKDNYTSRKNAVTYTVTGQEPKKYIIAAFQHGIGSGVVGDWNEWSNIQVEVSNTKTDYEPYRGGTHNVDFGKTVTGGTYDWTNGVLTDADGNETMMTLTEIRGLQGINSLWCDVGNTTVNGKADPVAIIEKLSSAVTAMLEG